MKIKDIAEITGLSKGTISKVINNYPGISLEVKEKVNEVIKEYGFVPNNFARNLSKNKTEIIGLFLFTEEGLQKSPFFENFVGIIIDEAEKQGISVLVSLINSKEKKRKIINFYKSKLIGGAIFLGMDSDEEEIENIQKTDFNAVLINYKVTNSIKNICCVDTGGYEGAQIATDYLLKCHCKNILHVTGSTERIAFKERLKGFQYSAEKAGVKYTVFQKNYVGSNIEVEFRTFLLNMKELPDGIFCGNDETAISVLKVLKELDIKVGHQIKVVGFDDIELSNYITPRLTTIKPNLNETAQKAIELLLKMMNKEENNQENYYKVKPKLIIRET